MPPHLPSLHARSNPTVLKNETDLIKGVKDIIYKWKRDTVTVEKIHIAQFVVHHVQIDSTIVTYESGEYL